jgi:hypothetical protein
MHRSIEPGSFPIVSNVSRMTLALPLNGPASMRTMSSSSIRKD